MNSRKLARLRVSVIVGLVFGAIMVSTPARAATITVNSTADGADFSPGDGICTTVRSGTVCTLRAAIQQANAVAGADTISVPAGTYNLTIAGSNEENSATGDLDINSDVTISGAGMGSTIIANNTSPKDRVLDVRSGSLTITGVTVRAGGGVSAGGGINVGSPTSLSSVAIEQNAATSTGGGIHANAAVTMSSGSITGNSAREGAGIYAQSSSVHLLSTSVISNTALSNGGGLDTESSVQTTITDSTFAQNSASNGAGVYAKGSVTIQGSTFSANTASSGGGGLEVQGPASLTNVTVSSNNAPAGAGILASGGPGATLDLRHVTVAFNSGSSSGGGIAQSGSMAVRPGASVIGNNNPQNCSISNAATWITLGSNVSNDVTCSLTASDDKPGQDPKLGPLANNGGATQTHEPASGSPAVEASSLPCPAADQRGIARAQDADYNGTPQCDAGAVEILPPPRVVSAIELSPPDAIHILGEPHEVTVVVRDQFNNPYPNGQVVFSVTGANSTNGTGMTGPDGKYVLNYSGSTPGQDTVEAFADKTADGQRQPDEPMGTVKVAWKQPGPPPAPECQGNPGAVCGTTADDNIVGTNGDDVIITGDGNDTIDCGGGNDTVISGAGVDTVNCGEGDDKIETGEGDDVVDCGAGNDDVDTGAGNDDIDCGDGTDVIQGGEGDDAIACGNDSDSADGGAGNDSILCGEGDDSVQGGEGADTVHGDGGNDLLVGDPTGASVRMAASLQTQTASNDILDGGAGKDVVLGRLGDDTAIGGTGNDYVDGDLGNDSLDGSVGNDAIRGDEGNDKLKGGPGKDALEGNLGKNGYDGGPGTDSCYIATGKNALKSCEKKKTSLKRNNM